VFEGVFWLAQDVSSGNKEEGRRSAFPSWLRTYGVATAWQCVIALPAIAGEAQRADEVAPAPSRWSFAEMDKMSGVKGWNYGFPSFGDTFLLDDGGWRSSLASAGIGLIEYNLTRFQANVLDTPREGPRFNPFYESNQNYWGQKPSFNNFSVLVLTYDFSRFGVPDGQLQYSGINTYATWQGFVPDVLTTNFLAY